MNNQHATPFGLLLLACFAIGCLLGAVAAWQRGVYLAVIVLALLALLALWSLTGSLRQGVRRATPFERFEQRLLVRAIAIVVGGGLALSLGHLWARTVALPWPPLVSAAITLLAIAAWLIAALLAVTRLRTKHETLGAYKRRVHYVEPTPPSSTRPIL